MNNIGKIALVVGTIVAQGSIAMAQSGAGVSGSKDNRLICRRVQETGSLAQTRRQCFTKAEWDRIADSQQTGARKVVEGLTERSVSN